MDATPNMRPDHFIPLFNAFQLESYTLARPLLFLLLDVLSQGNFGEKIAYALITATHLTKDER